MSKSKDKARAEKGEPFRHIPEGKVEIKCIYPPCNHKLIIDKPIPGKPIATPPLCPQHMEQLQFYMWCLSAVKVEPQQTPHGLILPGHQQFKPTIKEEALNKG